MGNAVNDVVKQLGNVELFSAMSVLARSRLLEEGGIEDFSRGQVVFSEEDPAEHMYVVLKGVIRLTKGHGQNAIELRRIEPPASFGELGLIDGGMRSATATATAPSQLLVLSQEAFHRALDTEPELRKATFRMLVTMIRRTTDLVTDFAFLDVKSRVATRLIELANDGSPDLTRTRRVTQREIAEMVGGSRQTVNQVIHLFEQAGLVAVDAEGLHVTDIDGLKAIAG